MEKKIKYLNGGVIDSKNDAVTTQQDAWAKEAHCGCGIDCCDGTLHLTREGVHYVTFVDTSGGTLSLKTVTKADWDEYGYNQP